MACRLRSCPVPGMNPPPPPPTHTHTHTHTPTPTHPHTHTHTHPAPPHPTPHHSAEPASRARAHRHTNPFIASTPKRSPLALLTCILPCAGCRPGTGHLRWVVHWCPGGHSAGRGGQGSAGLPLCLLHMPVGPWCPVQASFSLPPAMTQCFKPSDCRWRRRRGLLGRCQGG